MSGTVVLYVLIAYAIGMISLIVGSELGLRKLFSNPNIIDIDTSLGEMDFTKYLDFVYVEMGEGNELSSM